MSSATIVPALSATEQDFQILSSILSILSMSVFLPGTAEIPLVTAPLSEVFGQTIGLSVVESLLHRLQHLV